MTTVDRSDLRAVAVLAGLVCLVLAAFATALPLGLAATGAALFLLVWWTS